MGLAQRLACGGAHEAVTIIAVTLEACLPVPAPQCFPHVFQEVSPPLRSLLNSIHVNIY